MFRFVGQYSIHFELYKINLYPKQQNNPISPAEHDQTGPESHARRARRAAYTQATCGQSKAWCWNAFTVNTGQYSGDTVEWQYHQMQW
jgi:hypothetical protein